MKFHYTNADFEHLQDRVDVLENVLCDLVIFTEGNTITKDDLKQRLRDAGILELTDKEIEQ